MTVNWKASELPKNTLISTYNIDQCRDELWLNDPEGDWWLPIDHHRPTVECVYYREQDSFFAVEFFKVVSLPPEWLDEWKEVSFNKNWSINRMGKVQPTMSLEYYNVPDPTLKGKKFDAVEEVRKAFRGA